MARAPASGRRLNSADAAIIKGMIARGDRQHDIASYFAVNGGRVGETSTGERFSSVVPLTHGLPPCAPYLVISADLRVQADLLKKELEALGVPQKSMDRLTSIVDAMEQSRIARRGK